MTEPNSPIASSTLEYLRPAPERVPQAPKPRYWLHMVLLLATCFTTLVVGARINPEFTFGSRFSSIDKMEAVDAQTFRIRFKTCAKSAFPFYWLHTRGHN